MRGLTTIEYETMCRLSAPPSPGGDDFHGAALDSLEAQRRVERYDVDEEGYRMRPTEFGLLAVRLWPLTVVLPPV